MTTLNWFDKTITPARDTQAGESSPRTLAPASGLRLVAATILAGSASWLVAAMASSLPGDQALNVLSALAAGAGVPLAWRSLADMPLARGLFRSAVALAVIVLAYQALSVGWSALGFAWVVALAWVVMDWIAEGVNPLRLGLTVAFAGQALLAFGNV